MPMAVAFVASPVIFVRHEANAQELRRENIGPWRLEIRHDSFSGETRCVLRGHAVEVRRMAAIFQFPHRVDTFEAAYRIGNGPATSWRVNSMSLAAHGVRLSGDDLGHPSGGRVPIPLDVLGQTTVVAIRPNLPARIATFRLDGLSTAMAAAVRAGCSADFPGV